MTGYVQGVRERSPHRSGREKGGNGVELMEFGGLLDSL